MRGKWIIGLIMMLSGCSASKVEVPEEAALHLQMATEEASRFEDYIHTLGIYAFRKSAGDSYVYSRTLAEWEGSEITGLQDGSAKGDSKLVKLNLPVGIYELYMVGNAGKGLSETWREGVTVPAECLLTGTPGGQDSICFLGKANVIAVTEYRPPVRVTLERAVGKLVWVLYGVPLQIDSVKVLLGNLATEINLNGMPSGKGKSVSVTMPVNQELASSADTLVGEMVTFPSLGSGSPLELFFYAKNGQVKVKDMPLQVLLPNKYVRIIGVIGEGPSALLNFEIKVRMFIFDYFLDRTLPDFTLNEQK